MTMQKIAAARAQARADFRRCITSRQGRPRAEALTAVSSFYRDPELNEPLSDRLNALDDLVNGGMLTAEEVQWIIACDSSFPPYEMYTGYVTQQEFRQAARANRVTES